MESENETHPLLHDFENETWRSKARKRCLRIPSEVAITGMILGLFFVVVTLLIVLENMEDTKDSDLTLDKNLLASPFKYNKKAEDMSWQDKKENMKAKNKQNDPKWDKANKDYKKFPDISGKIDNNWNNGARKSLKDNVNILKLPAVVDDYGKDVDDSWEQLIDSELTDPQNFEMSYEDAIDYKSLLKSPKLHLKETDDDLKRLSKQELTDPQNFEMSYEDAIDYKSLLKSPKLHLKETDDDLKRLSKQGWKDTEIKDAISKALKEKKEEIKETEGLLQSSMNLNQLWGKINDDWKKKMQEGNKDYQKMKNKNEVELQKSKNDEWKNKMAVTQSPKSSMKKVIKADEGWNKLSEQGWKMDDLKIAMIEALKERGDLLQSPMSFENLWEKAGDLVKNPIEKGLDKQKSQKDMNDAWANKFGGLLQSPKSSTNKGGSKDEFMKKWTKYDQKDKTANKDGQVENPQSFNFEDLLENIFEKIKVYQKDNNAKNPNKSTTEKGNPEYSSIKIEDFTKNIIDAIKEHKKGNKEAENQKGINKEGIVNGMNVLKTAKNPDQKRKQIDDHWKTLIEYERNSDLEKKDGSKTDGVQHSMSKDNVKWDNVDSGWKKLTEQGWKDQDLKEAVYKAWKEGDKLLQSATGFNNMKWKKVNDGWKKISTKSGTVPTRCPIFKTQRDLLLGSAMAAPPIDCALITEEVRRNFGRCIDLSFLPKSCKPSWRTKCFSSYKYRKIDGTCNNKIHPTWGKSGIPFVRMIAPDYADGVSTFRKAKSGDPLPNSRFLSRKLYSKRMRPDADTSLLFLYFGLLVDHDMIETGSNTAAIPCCEEEFQENPQNRPNECLQIDISLDDPFYGPKNITCLNLIRSLPVNGECGGRREQQNKATSYLDGSAVYGSNMEHSKQLRTFSRGQLRTQLINNTPFMISSKGAEFRCGTPSEPLKCFEAGDSRVNMMVELTAMHTLWYREHNRIATILHKLNPNWKDETLYQETRRILIGELQHITYSELLPMLLGKEAIEEYELKIEESKQYKGYDDTIDATTFNVFGAAAFRFGHSLAPDMQVLLGANNSTLDKIALHKTFFSATILYHDGLDLLLRGAASQRTQSVDSYITPEVREHLFQPAELDYGYDLAAVGIQRGRDHGLPAYTRWRSVCGLSEVKTWEDLYKVMDTDRVDMLKSVYQSVDDIDLIPGALAENHQAGSVFGPTYVCLMGRQFKKTRKGDRYWYEIQNEIGSFTKDQLDQIYKSSMARIVCDNSDNIKEIQRHPFKVPSDANPVIDCSGIPKVDLTKWVYKF